MPYSLGVDLGASFTAVGIADDLGIHAAQLSPLLVVPSAVYFSPGGALLTGDEALRAGESDPAGLVRDFKKRLGDPTPLVVAGAQYSPEQLMAAQLSEVVAEVAEQRGEPADMIVLTYPVTWGPYRAEHFGRIAELAGIDAHSVVTEPVATAIHVDAQGGVKQNDVLAIVDFGSDAVTATILRKGADGFDILGTPEETHHVGSIDFDEAMRTLLDQKAGGRISAVSASDPSVAATLADIDHACRIAKETLSVRREALVSVALPDGVHQLAVTREEFARLIRPSVRLAVDALRRTIASAEIDNEAITNIVLTGGAARMPLVAEEFAELNRPVRSIHHPKLTVALGAAHAARALTTLNARVEGDEPVQTRADAAVMSLAGPQDESKLRRPSRGMLLGIIVVAVVLLAGLATALLVPLFRDAGTASSQSGNSTASPGPHAKPDTVFEVYEAGQISAGQNWYVSSAGEANDWGVAALREGAAEVPGISLEDTDDGMRAQWSSPDWPSQVYAQLREGTVDLSEITAADGALVFDLTVLSGSATDFRVAAHCTFPCAASVDITEVINDLERDSQAHLIAPAVCFADNGLDVVKVNTPFLLIGQGDIALTVDDIRWERESGQDPDALTC